MQIPADTPPQTPAIPDASPGSAPNRAVPTPPAAAPVPGEFLYTFRLWSHPNVPSSAKLNSLETLPQPLEAYQLPSTDNLAESPSSFHPWMANGLVTQTAINIGTSVTDTAYSTAAAAAPVERPSADISYLADPNATAAIQFAPVDYGLRPVMEDQAWTYETQNGQQNQWPQFQPFHPAQQQVFGIGLAAEYSIVRAPDQYPMGANDQPAVSMGGSLLLSTSLPANPLGPPAMQGMALGHLSSLPVVLAADGGAGSLAAPEASFMPPSEPQFFPGMGVDPSASFSAAQLLQRRGFSTPSLTNDAFLPPQPVSTAYPGMPYDSHTSNGVHETPPMDLYSATPSTMPAAASLATEQQHKPRVQSLPNVPMTSMPLQQSILVDVVPERSEKEKAPDTASVSDAKEQLPSNRLSEPLRWYQLQLNQQLQYHMFVNQPTPGPAAPLPRTLSKGKQQQQQKLRTKSADSGKHGHGNLSSPQKWPLGRPKKRRSLDLEAESAMRSATGVFSAAAPVSLKPVFIAFDPQSLSPARSPKPVSSSVPASTAQLSLDSEAEKTENKATRPRKRSKVGEGTSKAEQLASSPTESLQIPPQSTKSLTKKSQPAKKQPVDPPQVVGLPVRA